MNQTSMYPGFFDWSSYIIECIFKASLSCSCGDTLASELGPILFNKSNKWAFHIILWKKVPKGTNGGISFFGTLSSILGGFIVGLAYYLALKLAYYFHASMLLTLQAQMEYLFSKTKHKYYNFKMSQITLNNLPTRVIPI